MDSARHEISLEQRFQLFLDSAKDYAIFFSHPDGRICEWSRGAEVIFGYTEGEGLRLNSRDIFTEEDKARAVPEREIETAIRQGEANDERWHVRKDGSQFFAVGRMVALKEQDGRLRGFAKIVRDATPRKKLEELLHASEVQLRAVFAQASWGIILTDLHGRIEQTNASFCRMTGFTPEQLRGQPLVSVSIDDDREKAHAQVDRLFREKAESVSFEKRIRCADGRNLWVQNSITILRDAEGRPIGMLDLCQDISVMKTYEEELARRVDERTAALSEKTAQLEAFSYTIAHDLRAPLRTIAGYAELLQLDHAKSLPPPADEYVARIHRSAARLDRLIADLLGYTRVQQVAIASEDVDLSRLTHKVVEQVTAEARVADLRVTIETPLGHVRSDAVALHHVLLNLISNAVKFRRPDASPEVRIRTEPADGRTRVWVEDNGIGLDPRYRDRAFQMFERLHPHLDIPGTGVGLAIVAKAVERLGGTCGVEANEPHGSRFWFELPGA